MERIEVPAEVYFKAFDGKKFYSETECHRYEFLSDKYMNKEHHAICEDGEGHIHNFFFACTKDDIIEICELSKYLLGYRPQYVESAPKWENFECGWLWVDYDIDEYGPVPALGTVSDFIELQEECARSYNEAVQIAKQIRNLPGPRS